MKLAELAEQIGARLHGDPSVEVGSVAEPETAGPGQVALLTDPGRVELGRSSRAGALVVRRLLDGVVAAQLICADPARALARLVELFLPAPLDLRRGVDPRASVDETARVDPSAWIGPFVHVGPGATIGAGVRLEPFTYVGDGVQVGPSCRLGPRATVLAGCRLADGVVLGPGAVVGWRGFGYWRDETGWRSIPSRGGVVLDRDVELGANACVDAGTLAPTRLGQGVKVDNLVQVGHNCRVGAGSLLCGQVGLAGSVAIEPDCQLGGQVGVADHRRLGRGCRVAAHSGVARDVAPGQTVAGYPAVPHQQWLRSSVIFARLGQLARQVQQLSERVAKLVDRAD